MNIQFNPAALLSLGDAHAFVQALLDIAPKAPGVPKGGPTPSTVSTNTKMAQLDSGPEMGEQMAQRGAITSRSAHWEFPMSVMGEHCSMLQSTRLSSMTSSSAPWRPINCGRNCSLACHNKLRQLPAC